MATSTKTDPKAQWRGTVVEFFVDKRLTLGVCLEIKGERFLILTEGDREINLPESRFLHIAPHALNVQKGRDQLIQSLRDIAKQQWTAIRRLVPEVYRAIESLRCVRGSISPMYGSSSGLSQKPMTAPFWLVSSLARR